MDDEVEALEFVQWLFLGTERILKVKSTNLSVVKCVIFKFSCLVGMVCCTCSGSWCVKREVKMLTTTRYDEPLSSSSWSFMCVAILLNFKMLEGVHVRRRGRWRESSKHNLWLAELNIVTMGCEDSREKMVNQNRLEMNGKISSVRDENWMGCYIEKQLFSIWLWLGLLMLLYERSVLYCTTIETQRGEVGWKWSKQKSKCSRISFKKCSRIHLFTRGWFVSYNYILVDPFKENLIINIGAIGLESLRGCGLQICRSNPGSFYH